MARILKLHAVQGVTGGKWHRVSEFWDDMEFINHANVTIKAGYLRVPPDTIPEHNLCKRCFPKSAK